MRMWRQHAWVVSALAQYALYEKAGTDTHVAPKADDVPVDVELALLRGAQYLIKHIGPPVESSTDSPPESLSTLPNDEITNTLSLWTQRADGGVEATATGAAMALLALVLADKAVGGHVVDRNLLRSLASFLVQMQQRNGLFYHKVTYLLQPQLDAAKPVKTHVWDGVAKHGGLVVYALLLFSDLDREVVDGLSFPGSSWLKPAVRGLMGTVTEEERMRQYNIQYRTPTHHWLPIAAGELLRPGAPYLNRSALPDWYIFTDHFGSVEWSLHDTGR